MGRSPSLRVHYNIHCSFLKLAFALPICVTHLGLQNVMTRRLIMQKARHNLRSDTLFAHGFRFYFTPLKAVLFTFPSRYWFTIGCWLVFSLTGWSPLIHMQFLVLHITLENHIEFTLSQGAITLYSCFFQSIGSRSMTTIQVSTPLRVWAVPISLAATLGIAIALFSSPYWDVSLQAV